MSTNEKKNEQLNPSDLAPYIDHTLLKADATRDDIDKLIEEAIDNNFCSICVNTYWASYCAEKLKESSVKLCVVVGFPLGAMSTEAKAFETRKAVDDGADEVDMVLNIGALKSGFGDAARYDIEAVVEAAHPEAIVKVIIETALLTEQEKIEACRIVKEAGADFIKTSTGFARSGATPEDVALMRREVGPGMGVKAAGGVRTYEDALRMITAGANRIGTSGGVSIVRGKENTSGY